MDKQECLEILNQKINKAQEETDRSPEGSSYGTLMLGRKQAFSDVRGLLKTLDESEKPEIPHWLAERTEEYNIDSSVKFWRYVFNGSIFDPEERAWILDNDDIINKIFLCGYTVKELAWVVKEKESGDYLVDYKLSDNDVILSSSKANAYPFKDKQQAESVATLTNNTIEERNE